MARVAGTPVAGTRSVDHAAFTTREPALHKHEARIMGVRRGSLEVPPSCVSVTGRHLRRRRKDVDPRGDQHERFISIGVDDGGASFHVDEGYTEAWLQMSGWTSFPTQSSMARYWRSGWMFL